MAHPQTTDGTKPGDSRDGDPLQVFSLSSLSVEDCYKQSREILLSDDRIEYLGSTNHPPSASEIAALRKIVQQLEFSIACLDADIAKTVVPMDANGLVVKREQENHRLLMFRSILSPIRRIPNELLIEIFLLCREWVPDLGDFKPFLPSPRHSPLLLCRICSAWWRLVQSTPVLWKDVRFRRSLVGDQHIQLWMGRTGTTIPLDITLERSISSDSYNDSWLAPYYHRIRSLFWQGSIPLFTANSFDTLQSLKLKANHMPGSDSEIVFPPTPSLQNVTLHGLGVDLIVLPWAQLRNLSLFYVVLNKGFLERIICQCVSLQRLAIEGHNDYSNLQFTRAFRLQSHTLPSLQSLSLKSIGALATSHILRYITLPALKNLEIRGFEHYRGFLEAYTTVQSRSLFRLERLAFQSCPIHIEDFLLILAATPSLVELVSCKSVGALAQLFEALTYSDSPAVHYVPKLQYLSVENWAGFGGREASNDIIFNMIRSRWRFVEFSSDTLVSQLQRVSLNIEGWAMDDEALKQLAVWKADGLQVEIRRTSQ